MMSFSYAYGGSPCYTGLPADEKGIFLYAVIAIYVRAQAKRMWKALTAGFVGAGRVGQALGLYLANHKQKISGFFSKSIASSKAAAALTGADAFDSLLALTHASDIIFITTPDMAITDIDRQAAFLINTDPKLISKIWLHTSGAYSSEQLKEIKKTGCPVGSMHPLQSFGDPKVSAKQLENTYFNIHGTGEALEAIEIILKAAGNNYSLISAESKPLYHAGACIISNFLVTLLDSGISLMEAAGIERKKIFPAVQPLIMSTLENIRQYDTAIALTGPIARGDTETLSAHIKAIKEVIPEQLELYTTMAKKTAEIAGRGRLTAQQLQSILEIINIQNDKNGGN